VTANQKIMVQQYMLGQDAGGGAGDPAMTSALASSQFRTTSLFYAPPSYTSNYVNIVAPTGASVTLDGIAIPASSFVAVGASGYSYARLALSKLGTGSHTITGSLPVGTTVYGYGQYTSYSYPGGVR
jgi:hypothetical protein